MANLMVLKFLIEKASHSRLINTARGLPKIIPMTCLVLKKIYGQDPVRTEFQIICKKVYGQDPGRTKIPPSAPIS